MKKRIQYDFAVLEKRYNKIKTFIGKVTIKETGKYRECEIKECIKPVQWLTQIGEKTVLICFGHGEDLS